VNRLAEQVSTLVKGELELAFFRCWSPRPVTLAELIAVISAGITLLPGDIIATGTPAGVGIGFDPPKFMVSGDVIEVSITGLGAQRNRIA